MTLALFSAKCTFQSLQLERRLLQMLETLLMMLFHSPAETLHHQGRGPVAGSLAQWRPVRSYDTVEHHALIIQAGYRSGRVQSKVPQSSRAPDGFMSGSKEGHEPPVSAPLTQRSIEWWRLQMDSGQDGTVSDSHRNKIYLWR